MIRNLQDNSSEGRVAADSVFREEWVDLGVCSPSLGSLRGLLSGVLSNSGA